jgi:transcriptional regulator with XRE-family HTH domain
VNHKQFAKALQHWRESNDYTQQEAADKLGVSRRSLENWEQERAMPQGFGLAAMLNVIGVKRARAARTVRRKPAKR